MSGPSQYGTDEFDVEPEPGVRRGAHRTTPSRFLSVLPWLLGLLITGLVVVAMVSFVGGGDLELPGGERTAAAGDPSTTPGETSGAAPATGAPSPAPTQPPPPPTTPTPTTEPTTQAPPTPDRGIELTVLNGTRTSGLAARAARELEDEGWAVGTTDNFRDGAPPTTVFYASEDLRVTADAVADDLGVRAELDPGVTDSITVVLGSDYDP